jgi:hypothetical protein
MRNMCRQHAEDKFAAQDKVKPDTENTRGLNLVMVKLTTVEVTKLLCTAWTVHLAKAKHIHNTQLEKADT